MGEISEGAQGATFSLKRAVHIWNELPQEAIEVDIIMTFERHLTKEGFKGSWDKCKQMELAQVGSMIGFPAAILC